VNIHARQSCSGELRYWLKEIRPDGRKKRISLRKIMNFRATWIAAQNGPAQKEKLQ
jgi:hypothetical protein